MGHIKNYVKNYEPYMREGVMAFQKNNWKVNNYN